MHPSLLQTPLADGRIRCDVCQWRCELAPGAVGRCGVRSHTGQTISADAHSLISGATIGPIEDHRLWHFFPDAQVFSVGSFGTPLMPDSAAYADQPYALPIAGARELTAERAVQFAQQRLCRGVLWTFGDPAVALEWVYDGVKFGRAYSRFTAIATSGYFSPESFALLAPHLDGLRLDVYGFSDASYRTLTGLNDWRTIFKTVAEARQKFNIHIEVALRITVGVNDNDTEVAALAKWMRVALGSLTPLHILGETVDDTIFQRLQTAARGAGVHFVYGPAAVQSTRCPKCTWVVIERGAGPTQLTGVVDDTCEGCQSALGLRTSLFRRNVRYELAA